MDKGLEANLAYKFGLVLQRGALSKVFIAE